MDGAAPATLRHSEATMDALIEREAWPSDVASTPMALQDLPAVDELSHPMHVAEAFFDDEEEFSFKEFFFRVGVILLSPVCIPVLALYYSTRYGKGNGWRMLRDDGMITDAVFLMPMWYVAVYLFMEGHVEGDVCAAEVCIPGVMLAIFLAACVAEPCMESEDGVAVTFVSERRRAERLAEGLEKICDCAGLASAVRGAYAQVPLRMNKEDLDIHALRAAIHGMIVEAIQPWGSFFLDCQDLLDNAGRRFRASPSLLRLTAHGVAGKYNLELPTLPELLLPMMMEDPPADRPTQRRHERLRHCTGSFEVPLGLVEWPKTKRRFQDNGVHRTYKAQLEAGRVQASVLERQLRDGLCYQRTVMDWVVTLLSYMCAAFFCVAILIFLVLPMVTRPGRKLASNLAGWYIDLVWVWCGVHVTIGSLFAAPYMLSFKFMNLAAAHKSLNQMLSPGTASVNSLPYVRFHVPADVQAWAEVRNAIHFHNRSRTRSWEFVLGIEVICAGLLLASVAFYLHREGDDWKPGLLSFSALFILMILVTLISFALWCGTQLNSRITEQIRLLSREANKVVSYEAFLELGGKGAEKRDLELAYKLLTSTVEQLRIDSRNYCTLFGIELTPQGLDSVGSLVYSGMFLLYEKAGKHALRLLLEQAHMTIE